LRGARYRGPAGALPLGQGRAGGRRDGGLRAHRAGAARAGRRRWGGDRGAGGPVRRRPRGAAAPACRPRRAGRAGDAAAPGAAGGGAGARAGATLARLPRLVGDGELVVIPTGVLSTVPWAVLPGCAQRPVTVAPSGSAWSAAQERLRALLAAPDPPPALLVAG